MGGVDLVSQDAEIGAERAPSQDFQNSLNSSAGAPVAEGKRCQ